MTKKRRGKKPGPLLVDYEKLGHCFRDEYLAGLKRLLVTGQLKVQDPTAIVRLIDELSTIDWAVFIQPPPKETSRAEHVVRYLARYMTGGPISNRRLLSIDEHDNIYFSVRSKDKSGRTEAYKLSAVEFIQQWSLHILPKGFTKVRSFGQWAYTKRAAYAELCYLLRPPQQVEEVEAPEKLEEPRKVYCPLCKQQRSVEIAMQLVDFQPRPSWSELFYGPDHPPWLEQVHLPAAQQASLGGTTDSRGPPSLRGSPVSGVTVKLKQESLS